jgi:hypothetical protein
LFKKADAFFVFLLGNGRNLADIAQTHKSQVRKTRITTAKKPYFNAGNAPPREKMNPQNEIPEPHAWHSRSTLLYSSGDRYGTKARGTFTSTP